MCLLMVWNATLWLIHDHEGPIIRRWRPKARRTIDLLAGGTEIAPTHRRTKASSVYLDEFGASNGVSSTQVPIFKKKE